MEEFNIPDHHYYRCYFFLYKIIGMKSNRKSNLIAQSLCIIFLAYSTLYFPQSLASDSAVNFFLHFFAESPPRDSAKHVCCNNQSCKSGFKKLQTNLVR